jgi:hypothetical protein
MLGPLPLHSGHLVRAEDIGPPLIRWGEYLTSSSSVCARLSDVPLLAVRPAWTAPKLSILGMCLRSRLCSR